MLRPRINPWFWAELLTVAIVLRLLAALAFISDARASGVTNMLLGAGGYPILYTTLTAGTNVVSGNGEIGYCVTSTGICSSNFGSMSSTSLVGGYTVTGIYDLVVDGSVTQEVVKINGFSSSPGGSWLGKVIFNSQTFVGSAATYSYSTGTATWTWGTAGGWGFTSTDAYPGTITYQ